jgi:two-component system cell cycle sensor histidine kinase/response regulator CckA
MFESTAVGIAATDRNGHLLETNSALQAMLGYTEAELRVLSIADVTHPEDLGENRRLLDEVVGGRRDQFQMEKRYVRKDGSIFWGQLTVSAVRDERGRPSFVFGVIVDLGARKELEDQLRHAQKMEVVGKLAGGVAHEFNNLLAIIHNYARFAADEAAPGSAVRDDLDEVLKASDRARHLVRQLLTFSRKEQTSPVVLDLNRVVSETEKLLRRTLGEDVVLRSELDDDLPPTVVDRGQFEQVLMNLAINARDAMPGGGRLSIRTSRQSDAAQTYACLEVVDTGKGMTKDVADRAFEPFFTTKPAGHGTGLGLATVYGIVERAGGSIVVSSEPGHGTTFRIMLPAVDDEVTGSAPEEPLRATEGGGHETVLVVEDEDGVRELTRRMLSANGYVVLTAASAPEAIEMLERSGARIDLLLTDVVMPGMSGKDLAERLKAARPGLRTIFMSGYAGDIVASRGALEEGDAFLEKPFTRERLLEHVRAAGGGEGDPGAPLGASMASPSLRGRVVTTTPSPGSP